jgi:hypothetical protein
VESDDRGSGVDFDVSGEGGGVGSSEHLRYGVGDLEKTTEPEVNVIQDIFDSALLANWN